MGLPILFAFFVFAIWLIRRDTARREGISSALWIPTVWAGILLSRPVSLWLGFGGGIDTLEGSPLDRAFYLAMIFLALATLSRRNVKWSQLLARNWPIFAFYGYLLVSVLWADSPLSSFKRWFKDLGNIFLALVILTESNPHQALRAVFVRCAYVLLPLSYILVRYFPNLGRVYTRSGGLEVTGVTTQKNSLGVLVLICGLVVIWDWMETARRDGLIRAKVERYVPAGLLLVGAYLLYLCDSQTSILCLLLGASILAAIKVPFLRKRVAALGAYSLAAIVGFFLLDWIFGIKEALVGSLGRDMTFTGRTNVWHELLALKTDPLIGTGFCSIWSDKALLARLPEWVGASAHNGYLEMYIDGGVVGIFFLAVMLLAITIKTNRQLALSGNYAVFKFAILMVTLIGNFSESHFARMAPLWFIFLLTAFEAPRRLKPAGARMKQHSFDRGTARPVAQTVSAFAIS